MRPDRDRGRHRFIQRHQILIRRMLQRVIRAGGIDGTERFRQGHGQLAEFSLPVIGINSRRRDLRELADQQYQSQQVPEDQAFCLARSDPPMYL